jgi:hypothetical protein
MRLVRAAGEEFEQALPFGVVDQLRPDAGTDLARPAAGAAPGLDRLVRVRDRVVEVGVVDLDLDICLDSDCGAPDAGNDVIVRRRDRGGLRGDRVVLRDPPGATTRVCVGCGGEDQRGSQRLV